MMTSCQSSLRWGTYRPRSGGLLPSMPSVMRIASGYPIQVEVQPALGHTYLMGSDPVHMTCHQLLSGMATASQPLADGFD